MFEGERELKRHEEEAHSATVLNALASPEAIGVCVPCEQPEEGLSSQEKEAAGNAQGDDTEAAGNAQGDDTKVHLRCCWECKHGKFKLRRYTRAECRERRKHHGLTGTWTLERDRPMAVLHDTAVCTGRRGAACGKALYVSLMQRENLGVFASAQNLPLLLTLPKK